MRGWDIHGPLSEDFCFFKVLEPVVGNWASIRDRLAAFGTHERHVNITTD